MKTMEILRLIFFWFTTPIQKFMQRLNAFLRPRPKMTEENAEKIVRLAKPGFGVLCSESHHVTNYFIPGSLDHIAILYRGKTRMFVIEAVGEGVQAVPLREWLYAKDDVVLIRDLVATPEQMIKAGKWANSMVGLLSYDTLFQDLPKLESVRDVTPKDLKKTYCARFYCNALDIPFEGVIEPVQILKNKRTEIVYTTKGDYNVENY